MSKGLRSKPKVVAPLQWTITPWLMNGQGGWTQQPVILVEGRIPFFADHPDAYIAKLLELHDDPALTRMMNLYTLIGQFKDALEYYWNPGAKEVVAHEDGSNQNGQRAC